jgi:hypothetical protein
VDHDADLKAATKFVIDRIAAEATQSGKRLTSEEQFLLENLPHTSPAMTFAASDPRNLTPVPRDLNYERISALAKHAYLADFPQNHELLKWECASAVFLFHNDPMWTLLHYAGVRNHRPWWDPFLLLFGALLWIAITLATFFVFLRESKTLTAVQWTEVFIVIVPMTILMGFGARRIQRWELDQEIERCSAGISRSDDQ